MDSKKAFFMQRLNDHIQYLDKVTKTIKGKADFHGSDCHCCKLGVWLDTEGKQEIEAYASGAAHLFDTLVTQHEQFHSISSDVLTLHSEGNTDSAYKSMTEMHKLSGQLVSLLLQIDRESRKVNAVAC
ncbi:MAG: hypothetical protein RI964_1545 [Pseudomonadota bacterium]|jgi:hypothetical protein